MPDPDEAVLVGDTATVAAAAGDLLAAAFGPRAIDRALLGTTFAWVDRIYRGEDPDFLGCDLPYHDLRHALDVALLMARLVNGYCREQGAGAVLTPPHGLLGVLLGLLHDTGYLRGPSEADRSGPFFGPGHEARSVVVAANRLRTGPLADRADRSALMLSTRLGADVAATFAGRDDADILLGRMLGSADLVSQVADPRYIERCAWHLYPELVLGGADRVRRADGSEQLLWRNAREFVAGIPAFIDVVVLPRLERDFDNAWAWLAVPGTSHHPHRQAIADHRKRAATIAADGDLHRVGPEPPTTTGELAAVYHRLDRSPG